MKGICRLIEYATTEFIRRTEDSPVADLQGRQLTNSVKKGHSACQQIPRP